MLVAKADRANVEVGATAHTPIHTIAIDNDDEDAAAAAADAASPPGLPTDCNVLRRAACLQSRVVGRGNVGLWLAPAPFTVAGEGACRGDLAGAACAVSAVRAGDELLAERPLLEWPRGTYDAERLAPRFLHLARRRRGGCDDGSAVAVVEDKDEEVARTLRTALFPRCLQNDVPAARAAQVSDTTVERIQAAVAKIELGAAAAQANGSSVLVVRPAGPPPTREEVVRALFVLEMNSFPSGLLGFLSLANHSCSPNCKVVEDFEAVGKGVTSEDAARDEDSRREEDDSGNNTHNESDESDIESGVDEVELDDQDDDDDGFDDDKNSCVDYRPIYRLVALRDLRPGEDVTISYLDLDHELLTAEDRRCRLAEHYQFECACGLCEPPRREDYICVVPATAAAAAAAGGPIGAVASVAGTPAGNTKAAVGVCGGRVSALSGECRRCGARLTARELDRLDDRVRATKRRAAVAVERVDAAAEALRRAVAAEARQRRRRRRRRAVGEDGGVVEESTKAGNGVALTAPTTEAVATELESSKPPDLVELRRRVRFGNNSTGRGSVAAATAELRGRIRELSAERARATQLLYAGDGDGTGSSGRAEYAPNDDGDNDQGGGRHVLFRPMDFVLGDGREALSEMEQRQLRKGRGAEAGVKAGSDGGVKGRGGASAGDGGGGRGGRRRRRR